MRPVKDLYQAFEVCLPKWAICSALKAENQVCSKLKKYLFFIPKRSNFL